MGDLIYTVTTVGGINEGYSDDIVGLPWTGDIRLVGAFKTLEQAEGVVKNNMCDIWETCYDYAVVQEVPLCLYPFTKEHWFKYDREKDNYISIDKPKQFKGTCGWGIG